MQTFNLSDGKTILGYVNKTNAQLKIMSVPTQQTLLFPAFLTDFSQTFDASWNTEDVFGRMDPIATYQGTKRTMSLGFDLPAASLKEAKDNLRGCSRLVRMVYPVYDGEILAKPPLVRIKFANLITNTLDDGLLGWITGLSWRPVLDMGMFTSDSELFPKVISISFSFNILHEINLDQEMLDYTDGFPFEQMEDLPGMNEEDEDDDGEDFEDEEDDEEEE
jgi:hypothetical protein